MPKPKSQSVTARERIRREAEALIKDPLFLHHAMKKIGNLGVIREKRNRLIVFLAGLTKDHGQPVSLLIKGTTASGKSNLVSNAIRIFPPECLLTRASMSKQAPVFGEDPLDGKILYLFEYRGTRGVSPHAPRHHKIRTDQKMSGPPFSDPH